jgi:hypothetical protein
MVDRVYAQYRDKPKAVAWYSIVPSLAEQISDAFESVRTSWDISTGEQHQLDVIGRIVSMQFPFSTVNDVVVYRALIRSKIAKNNSDATLDGVVTAMQFILPNTQVIVGDFENMTMDVSFLTAIDLPTINLLNTFDIVPRPQGVRFRGYAVLPSSIMYGDDEAQCGDDEAQYGFYFGGSG